MTARRRRLARPCRRLPPPALRRAAPFPMRTNNMRLVRARRDDSRYSPPSHHSSRPAVFAAKPSLISSSGIRRQAITHLVQRYSPPRVDMPASRLARPATLARRDASSRPGEAGLRLAAHSRFSHPWRDSIADSCRPHGRRGRHVFSLLQYSPRLGPSIGSRSRRSAQSPRPTAAQQRRAFAAVLPSSYLLLSRPLLAAPPEPCRIADLSCPAQPHHRTASHTPTSRAPSQQSRAPCQQSRAPCQQSRAPCQQSRAPCQQSRGASVAHRLTVPPSRHAAAPCAASVKCCIPRRNC